MAPRGATWLSPRRRRLRRTLLYLSAAAGVAVVVMVSLHLRGRPEGYVPGEASPDITSSLSRGLPASAPSPRFVDVTAEAGLESFRTFSGERTSQLPEDMGPGLAWGDFDRDGDEDLFLVSAGGSMALARDDWHPCQLYENLGNGTFALSEAMPPLRLLGMAAAWADYDGDGFLDLAVSGYGELRLFRNRDQGEGRRWLVEETMFQAGPGYWSGLAWGDFDRDRDLDLYACQYVDYVADEADRGRGSDQLGTFVPYTLNPASYTPGTNALFRNEGEGRFVDIAGPMGVANREGRSLGALWHDFDGDGWLDLYVANDVSDNVLYHNREGRFVDISHAAWVADYRSAMGMAVGDWNRDGDDDLFITHWVAQENALYDNLQVDLRRIDSGPASAQPAAGNASREPLPPVRFVDVNALRGLGQVALPAVGWGTEFADWDGDGWLDLIVANGSTIETKETRQLKRQVPFLFWNQQGEHFHDLAPLLPALTVPHVSRGLALADYDRDGDLDWAVTHLGEGVQLFRNDMQAGRWIQVRLHSLNAAGQPHGQGEGAVAVAHVAGTSMRRSVTSASYLSQSSRTLHFGLGDARQVDRLEVRWLGGTTNLHLQLAANRLYDITEGQPEPRSTRLSTEGSGARVAVAEPARSRPETDRQRTMEFWRMHRAAMDALKVEGDVARAIPLFEEALALKPDHEDARYYLALCLAEQGEPEEALAHLTRLKQLNPQSHRAHRQWGIFRALHPQSSDDVKAAKRSLEEARRLNPEETGALLVLAEIAALEGDWDAVLTHAGAVCSANVRSAGGWFLQGLAWWKKGEDDKARQQLVSCRKALGPEWQPAGTTGEGDVKKRLHEERTVLSRFWQGWDGNEDPDAAYAALDAHLGRDRLGPAR